MFGFRKIINIKTELRSYKKNSETIKNRLALEFFFGIKKMQFDYFLLKNTKMLFFKQECKRF
jgi:hypothetical protein